MSNNSKWESLTATQLAQLRADLQQLARIEYDEVLDELLDHYATLTEQQMAAGLLFADASKWAWQQLGSGNGLAQVQDDWETAIKRQIKTRHMAIVKSYFRWPTIVTTLLVAVLVFLAVPYLSGFVRALLLLMLSLVTTFMLMHGRRKKYNQQTNSRKLVWAYLSEWNSFVVNLAVFGLNLPNGLLDEKDFVQTFVQTYTGMAVALCLLVLVYTASTVQLYREQFRVAVA